MASRFVPFYPTFYAFNFSCIKLSVLSRVVIRPNSMHTQFHALLCSMHTTFITGNSSYSIASITLTFNTIHYLLSTYLKADIFLTYLSTFNIFHYQLFNIFLYSSEQQILHAQKWINVSFKISTACFSLGKMSGIIL